MITASTFFSYDSWSIFRITKLHNLLKQQQEMMRQMADHLHVDIKLDSLSLAESLRSEMASRIGL